MLVKIIRILGVMLIICFASFSIYFALEQQELGHTDNQSLLTSYPSFFEDRFYDIRANMTLDKFAKDDRLVMAAIDDESLSKIGRFPWPRKVWVDVLDKLKNYGAKVVMFDVFFFEEEKACNVNQHPDDLLAEAIKDFQSIEGNKVILPYQTTRYEEDGLKEAPEDLFNFMVNAKQDKGQNLQQRWVSKSNFVIPKLASTGAMLGHVQADADPDGIIRQYLALANVDSLYFPSAAVQVYMAYTKNPVEFEITPADNRLKLKNSNLSLNTQGSAKVRWFGTQHNFGHVSIHKLLSAKDDDLEMKKLLEGNIVFLGSTAFGAHDLRHTPVDPMLPGVYFHMNMVHSMLEGKSFQPKEKSVLISWGVLIAATILMILIQLLGNAIIDLFVVSVITLGLFFADTYLMTPNGYEIKLFFCLFSVVACYSWNTFLNFYLSTKEKKKIKGTFSRYVSPAIVDQMLDDPSKLKVGGERKNITVFFSDVRDFTTISEKLTPEQLSYSLNHYMGIMTDIIFESKGTLDKYIGDAIVAFWGAPVPIENHPYQAIKAALKMIEVLPSINEKFKAEGLPEFKHGIGLNTGDCSVGNMGSDKIFAYTALGDNMNLGARTESLCKYYGVQLNITENTIHALTEEQKNTLSFRTLDKVRVKGKEQPVTLFEGLHSTHPFKVDSEALKNYEDAFKCYQNKQFGDAIVLLQPINEKYPEDKSTKRILHACEDFLKNPPPENWDGVFTHTTKG